MVLDDDGRRSPSQQFVTVAHFESTLGLKPSDCEVDEWYRGEANKRALALVPA